MRRFTFFWLLLLGLNAFGEFTLPDLTTPEKVNAFTARIEIDAPWLQGNSAIIKTGSVPLIPQLLQDPLWRNLAKERGEPIELLVDVVQPVEKQVRRVKPNVLVSWKQEMERALAQVRPPDLDIKKLSEKISQELDWLVSHDSRAVVTGLINSLSKEKRGEYFKIGTVQEQLKSLRKAKDLNDGDVKANFRAADFGMDPNSVSKEAVVSLLEESLNREESLAILLRSGWLLSNLNQDDAIAFAENPADLIQKSKESELDFFGLEASEQKQFLDGFLAIAANDKRKSGYLQRMQKAQFQESDYKTATETVDSAIKTFRAVETSPAMGATRGWLMGDCSMQAYGFAYLPLEYTYLIYDETAKPVGFLVATAVRSGDQRVFYVHDFGGVSMTAELQSHVIHGFYQALSALGFQQMTVAGKNGNIGPWAQVALGVSGRAIPLTYLDLGPRALVKKVTGYPHHYDSPESNANAAVFKPVAQVMSTTRSRIIRSGSPVGNSNVQSKPASILQALTIFNANPEAGITSEMLQIDGVNADDLFALFAQLKNEAGLSLEEYYRRVGEIFEKFKINLSKNFARENAHLFQDGHLNASDAAKVQDSALFNRTVDYVTQSLKSQRNPARAINLIKNNMPLFMANPRFQAYLKSFTGRGQNEGLQVEQLMALGLAFDQLSQDLEVLKRFANSNSPAIRYWALGQLPMAELQGLTDDTVRKIAGDLELDHDDFPRLASKYLMQIRSQDLEVLKQLKATMEEEEESDIALRSAIALNLNGQSSIDDVQKSFDKAAAGELDGETAAMAERILGQSKKKRGGCEKALR